MKSLTRKRLPWLVLLALMLMPCTSAFAMVTSVTVAVSPTQIPLGKSATVRVTWTVSGAILAAGSPDTTLSSQAGEFWSGPRSFRTQLGSYARALTRSVPSAGYNVTFSETVFVPASVSYKAFKAGWSTFDIIRSFNDGGGASSGFVSVKITGSGSAGLNIGRQALYFDDGSVRRLLERDTPIHAFTRLSYSGSGLIKGVWELADPTSTFGEPLYRTLQVVRQFIAAGGEVVLRSPALPSHLQGRYLVRFRIQEPVAFDELNIEYFVSQPSRVAEPPITLELQQPADGVVLHADQEFVWAPDPLATAYQLELFPKGLTDVPELPPDQLVDPGKQKKNPSTLEGSPTAGALIPAKQTRLSLSALTQGHLESGRSYWWRVLAIGESGTVISQSQVREIHVP